MVRPSLAASTDTPTIKKVRSREWVSLHAFFLFVEEATMAPAKEFSVIDDNEKSQMEAAKFRSVLPHEPLPKQSYGYLHIQGAFEPKQKQRPIAKESVETTKDDDNNKEEEFDFYWKTQAQLHDSLFDVLSNKYQTFNFPAPVCSVLVLDPNPPFTKVRLSFPSPKIAKEAMIVWRTQKLAPKHIFSSSVDDNNNNNDSIHKSNVTFGSHVFQATLITDNPLPSSNICWSRSNPPKFRRLLAREGEDDTSLIDQERSETRFVFMTGLLEHPIPPQDSFWNQSQHVVEAIRSVVNEYDTSGLGAEIFVSHKKMAHSCHIGMRSADDAKRLIQELQGKHREWKYTHLGSQDNPTESLSSGSLFLDYVAITKQSMAISKARAEGKTDSIDIKGEPSRPECTSTTDDVVVPGLVLVPDFVTPAEEEVLMAVLTGPQAPWAPSQTTLSQTGFVKRLVQHYGYVFDYETADVLRCRTNPGADCPPLPAIPTTTTTTTAAVDSSGESSLPSLSEPKNLESLSQHYTEDCRGWELFGCIIERTRQFQFETEESDASGTCSTKKAMAFPNLNQVTINHYKPGEGIGSHVDTPPAFSDGLISISLNGGIVMEFRKVGNVTQKKLVYLPPRSLVLMSGPARYEWEHMIVTRRTDTVNGQVLPRKLRLSLTLRTAITLDNPPVSLPKVESSQFPPLWGGGGGGPNNSDNAKELERKERLGALVTPSTERDHVHAVYDAIATQWHHTRGKRGVLWPGATQFLQRLPPGSVVADVGCGDGKYFPAVWEAGSYVIGTDISLPLLQKCMSFSAFSITQQKDNSPTTTSAASISIPDTCKVSPDRVYLRDRPATAVADCMSVPLRSKSCDAAICIAVMHHLSTEQRRLRCIEELVRIVQVGGTINIQAWAHEQENDSRRRFAARDVFVPFNAQPKYLDKVQQRDTSKLSMESSSNVSPGVGQSSTTMTAPNHPKESKSVAQVYSEAYKNADFDEKKGLVVFQRYCHVYQKGELEALVARVPNVALLESGYETGNHFVILEVTG